MNGDEFSDELEALIERMGDSELARLDVYARWVDCWKEQERKYGT